MKVQSIKTRVYIFLFYVFFPSRSYAMGYALMPQYPSLAPVLGQGAMQAEDTSLFDFLCQDQSKSAIFSSEEYFTKLSSVREEDRLAYLQSLFSSIPDITHEDLFKMLSAFKKNDQALPYKWLIRKVHTKMSSYPTELFFRFKQKIDIKILAAEVNKCVDIEHSDSVRHARKIIKGLEELTSSQLERVLMLIALKSSEATSEKELVGLRDKLRLFTDYDESNPQVNEWTASDLFLMKVPLNIDILIEVLQMCRSIDVGDKANISELIDIIMKSARNKASNIAINPHKPKMKIPKLRGVDWQVIENLIQSNVKRLGVLSVK